MPYLQMQGITKRFGSLVANDGVDFSLERGEIHALVGENGAGKTTLMRMLYGMAQPDAGSILLDGRPVHIDGPQQALRLGVGMVHQHFQLVPSLTALENVVLGVEPHRGPWVDRDAALRRVQDLSKELGASVPWQAPIRDLSLGAQQRVETLRLLYRDARILIFDEPTTILIPQEVENLFSVLRRLAASGRAVILITHKLREVLSLAHRITVLRQGRVVAVTEPSQTSPDELARLMVGEVIPPVTRGETGAGREPVLTVSELRMRDAHGAEALRGLSFTLHAGELLGVAGVEGNGQRELVDALLGLAPVHGSIRLQGTELIGLSTHERRHRGLAVIPADRNTDGVCRSASIAENLVATCFGDPPYARVGVLRPAAIAAHAREVIARFRVRDASPRQPIGSLSGGNMQRLVVAREVQSAPAVLVATYPTRGVDVRAARFIRSLLLDLRAQGRSVILISEDLSEIVEICDRLIVLFEGRVVGECPVEEAEPRRLGRLMMGEDVGENTASAGNVAWHS